MKHEYNETYSLDNFISKLQDNVAIVGICRGIGHSAQNSAITAVRREIRNRKTRERIENENPSCDQRNAQDAFDKGEAETATAWGFDVPLSPLSQASIYNNIYDWANNKISEISMNPFDSLMSLNVALDFMTNSARPIDESVAELIAKTLKNVDPKMLIQMRRAALNRELENIRRDRPEIEVIMNGLSLNTIDTEWYGNLEAPLSDLPPVLIQRFATRGMRGLNKARDSLINRMWNGGAASISENAGDIYLIDKNDIELRKWTIRFEREFKDQLMDAIESGVNIQFTESVPSIPDVMEASRKG